MAKNVKNTTKPGLNAPSKLKILVTIVDRNKGAFYRDVLEGFDVNFQTTIYGKGTTPSEVREMLGFADDSKALLLSVVNETRVKEILNAYEDKYFKTKNGKGIAFTLPISSMIGVMIYQFLASKGEQ